MSGSSSTKDFDCSPEFRILWWHVGEICTSKASESFSYSFSVNRNQPLMSSWFEFYGVYELTPSNIRGSETTNRHVSSMRMWFTRNRRIGETRQDWYFVKHGLGDLKKCPGRSQFGLGGNAIHAWLMITSKALQLAKYNFGTKLIRQNQKMSHFTKSTMIIGILACVILL